MNRSPPPGQDQKSVVIAWSLYDLANTIFYLLVVTIYVPKFLAEMTGAESNVNWGLVPGTILASILLPAYGAWLGRHGRAKGLTIAFTSLACAATAAMAIVGDWRLVAALFGLAMFAYHLASVSYQSLLPAVASPARAGRVSGLGVALGYLGNIVALLLLDLTNFEERFGLAPIFVLAALLFFGFTLPFARKVPRFEGSEPDAPPRVELWRGLVESVQVLKRTARTPGLGWFLLGHFLVCDAVNTVLVQIARYAENDQGLGLEPGGRTRLLIVINVSAVLGGLLMGRISDRIGGKRATLLGTVLLALGVLCAEFVGVLALRTTAISVLGGVGVAGIWTAGRHWMLQLVPEGQSSEAFGLYGLTMKISLLSLPAYTWWFDASQSYRGPNLVVIAFLAAGLWIWWRCRAQRMSTTTTAVEAGPGDAGADAPV